MNSSSPEISFRNASPGDLGNLKALALKAYGQYASQLGTEQMEKMSNGLADEDNWAYVLSISKSFVAVSGNKIVGMAFLIPSGNPWFVFEADWSYIRLVGVDPGFQGLGICTSLTTHCIAEAKRSREKMIALHTSEIMPARPAHL